MTEEDFITVLRPCGCRILSILQKRWPFCEVWGVGGQRMIRMSGVGCRIRKLLLFWCSIGVVGMLVDDYTDIEVPKEILLYRFRCLSPAPLEHKTGAVMTYKDVCLLAAHVKWNSFFQSEQKRFLQQHKQRSETYSKAAAIMKKQRKKNKGTTKTGLAMDKELKVGPSEDCVSVNILCCPLHHCCLTYTYY